MPDEMNARWQRDHDQLTRLAVYLAAIAVVTWPLTYLASNEALWAGHGQWWPIVCGVLLAAAIGTTIGAAVANGFRMNDRLPLPGSNY